MIFKTEDVRADKENETIWLTQEEMALLFDMDRTRITRHIAAIYKEGELEQKSTCAESAHMGAKELRQPYSLTSYVKRTSI